MRKTYYYVPPCPKCGSYSTGRYVLSIMQQKMQMMIDAYNNGEIVDFYNRLKEENAFCCSCGYEWNAEIKTYKLTEEQIEKEAKKRDIDSVIAPEVLEEIKKRKNWGRGRKFVHNTIGV